MKNSAIAIALSLAIFLPEASSASSCRTSIDRAQARIDAAIQKQARASKWRRESNAATLSRQPTPESLANAEGAPAANLRQALSALDQARLADDYGNVALCRASVRQAVRLTLTR